jgi:hypothetical protein
LRKRVSAIVQAYYPQHWGGQAVVDVLTGKVNPAGRLVNTWPKEYDEALHGKIGAETLTCLFSRDAILY